MFQQIILPKYNNKLEEEILQSKLLMFWG